MMIPLYMQRLLKQSAAILISLCLVWTCGNAAEAAAIAPDVFAVPSNLPQFRLIPPGQFGRIVDYSNAPVKNPKLVVLIQDLHAHYGVQKNIAGILDFLTEKLAKSKERDIPFALAVEGAEGPIDSSVLALFPDPKIKEDASQFLMREGELTGAEYFAVKRGIPDLLTGVEDGRYYTLHRELFRKTFENRSRMVQALKAIQQELVLLPRYVFRKNRSLWEFEKTVQAYDQAELSTHEFIEILMRHVTGSIDLKKDFPTLAAFAANGRFGTMEQVRAATAQFLTDIQTHLSPEEKADLKLLAKSHGNSTYYLYLRELVYRRQLFLAVPPELAQYMEYIYTAQTKGMDRVTYETKELAYRIEQAIAGQGPAADLVQVKHDLDLLVRIADLQADEFEVRAFAPRLNQFVAMAHALKLHFDETTLRQLISSSIDFYAMALLRNRPMVDNTLSLLKPGAPSVAALVTGGFHTSMLTQILREKHVSYIVISPFVENLTEKDHELYVKRLNGQFLSRDEIFAAAEKQDGLNSKWAGLFKRQDNGLAVGLFGLAIAAHFLDFAAGRWVVDHHTLMASAIPLVAGLLAARLLTVRSRAALNEWRTSTPSGSSDGVSGVNRRKFLQIGAGTIASIGLAENSHAQTAQQKKGPSQRAPSRTLADLLGLRPGIYARYPDTHGPLEVLNTQLPKLEDVTKKSLGWLINAPGDPHLVAIPIKLLPKSLVTFLASVKIRSLQHENLSLLDYLTRNVDEIIFAPYMVVTDQKGSLLQVRGRVMGRAATSNNQIVDTTDPDRPGRRIVGMSLSLIKDSKGEGIRNANHSASDALISPLDEVDMLAALAEEVAHHETFRLINTGQLHPKYFDLSRDWTEKIGATVQLEALDSIEQMLAKMSNPKDAHEFIESRREFVKGEIRRFNRALGLPLDDFGRKYLEEKPASGVLKNKASVQPEQKGSKIIGAMHEDGRLLRKFQQIGRTPEGREAIWDWAAQQIDGMSPEEKAAMRAKAKEMGFTEETADAVILADPFTWTNPEGVTETIDWTDPETGSRVGGLIIRMNDGRRIVTYPREHFNSQDLTHEADLYHEFHEWDHLRRWTFWRLRFVPVWWTHAAAMAAMDKNILGKSGTSTWFYVKDYFGKLLAHLKSEIMDDLRRLLLKGDSNKRETESISLGRFLKPVAIAVQWAWGPALVKGLVALFFIPFARDYIHKEFDFFGLKGYWGVTTLGGVIAASGFILPAVILNPLGSLIVMAGLAAFYLLAVTLTREGMPLHWLFHGRTNVLGAVHEPISQNIHPLVLGRLANRPREFKNRFAKTREFLAVHTTLSSDVVSAETIVHSMNPRLDPWLPLLLDLLAYEMAIYHYEPQVGDLIEFDHRTDDRTGAYMRTLGEGKVLIAINLDKATDDADMEHSVISEAVHAVDELVLSVLGYSSAIGRSDDELMNIRDHITEVLDMSRRVQYGDESLREVLMRARSEQYLSFGGGILSQFFKTWEHQRAVNVAASLFGVTQKAHRDAKRQEKIFGQAMVLVNLMRTADYVLPDYAEFIGKTPQLETRFNVVRSAFQKIRTDEDWLKNRDLIVRELGFLNQTIRNYLISMLSQQPLFGNEGRRQKIVAEFAMDFRDMDRTIRELEYAQSIRDLENNHMAAWFDYQEENERDIFDFMADFFSVGSAVVNFVDAEFDSLKNPDDLLVALQFAISDTESKTSPNNIRARVILEGLQADLGKGVKRIIDKRANTPKSKLLKQPLPNTTTQPPKTPFMEFIEQLPLTVQAFNDLRKAGVGSIEELRQWPMMDVTELQVRYPIMKLKSILEIRYALSAEVSKGKHDDVSPDLFVFRLLRRFAPNLSKGWTLAISVPGFVGEVSGLAVGAKWAGIHAATHLTGALLPGLPWVAPALLVLVGAALLLAGFVWLHRQLQASELSRPRGQPLPGFWKQYAALLPYALLAAVYAVFPGVKIALFVMAAIPWIAHSLLDVPEMWRFLKNNDQLLNDNNLPPGAWRPDVKAIEQRWKSGRRDRIPAIPRDFPIIQVPARDAIFPETGVSISLDPAATARLKAEGIDYLIGEALTSRSFLNALSLCPSDRLIQFLKENFVYGIHLPDPPSMSASQKRRSSDEWADLCGDLHTAYPKTIEALLPVMDDFVSKIPPEHEAGFFFNFGGGNAARILNQYPLRGPKSKSLDAYKLIPLMAGLNATAQRITELTNGQVQPLADIVSPLKPDHAVYYSPEAALYAFERLLSAAEQLRDPSRVALLYTYGLNMMTDAMVFRTYENGGLSAVSSNFEAVDAAPTYQSLVELLERGEIRFNRQDYKVKRIYPLSNDLDKAEVTGKNPSFVMELESASGETREIILKWVGRESIANDEIATEIADKLNLLSYHVEPYGYYRERHGDMGWEMIEKRPAVLVAYTSSNSLFKSPGLEQMLSGSPEDIRQRLEQLGGLLALEYILDAEDAKMKHILMDPTANPSNSLFRIDWEYLFDVRLNNGSTVLKGDERNFLDALAPTQSAVQRYLGFVAQGFEKTIALARERQSEIDAIVHTHLPDQTKTSHIQGIRDRLKKTNETILKEIDFPSTKPTAETPSFSHFSRAHVWATTKANDLHRQVVESLKQHKPATRKLSPDSVPIKLGLENQAYESWGDATGSGLEFRYIRIGSLFFMNADDYDALPASLKADLGGNVLKFKRLNDTSLAHLGYGVFTTTSILAMTRLQLEGKRWIGAGAGDGVMELVAAKLGAASLDLIDIDSSALGRGRDLLTLNNLEEGKDFRIVEGDLAKPEELVERLELTAENEAVLGSNIGQDENGPWREYKVTNSESMDLLAAIERRAGMPRITDFVAGGYFVEFNDDHTVSAWSSEVHRDLARIKSIGFQSDPEQYALIIDMRRMKGSMAFAATRQVPLANPASIGFRLLRWARAMKLPWFRDLTDEQINRWGARLAVVEWLALGALAVSAIPAALGTHFIHGTALTVGQIPIQWVDLGLGQALVGGIILTLGILAFNALHGRGFVRRLLPFAPYLALYVLKANDSLSLTTTIIGILLAGIIHLGYDIREIYGQGSYEDRLVHERPIKEFFEVYHPVKFYEDHLQNLKHAWQKPILAFGVLAVWVAALAGVPLMAGASLHSSMIHTVLWALALTGMGFGLRMRGATGFASFLSLVKSHGWVWAVLTGFIPKVYGVDWWSNPAVSPTDAILNEGMLIVCLSFLAWIMNLLIADDSGVQKWFAKPVVALTTVPGNWLAHRGWNIASVLTGGLVPPLSTDLKNRAAQPPVNADLLGALNEGVWKIVSRSDEVDIYEVQSGDKTIIVLAEKHPTEGQPHDQVRTYFAGARRNPSEWLILQEVNLLPAGGASQFPHFAALPNLTDGLLRAVQENQITMDDLYLALAYEDFNAVGRDQVPWQARAVSWENILGAAAYGIAGHLELAGKQVSKMEIFRALEKRITPDNAKDLVPEVNRLLELGARLSNESQANIIQEQIGSSPLHSVLVHVGKAHLPSLIDEGPIADHTAQMIARDVTVTVEHVENGLMTSAQAKQFQRHSHQQAATPMPAGIAFGKPKDLRPIDETVDINTRLRRRIERGTGWVRIVAKPQEALKFHQNWMIQNEGVITNQVNGRPYHIPVNVWRKMTTWMEQTPDFERQGYFLYRESAEGFEIVDFVPLGSYAHDPELGLGGEGDDSTTQQCDMFKNSRNTYGLRDAAASLDLDYDAQEQLLYENNTKDRPDVKEMPVHSHHAESKNKKGPSKADRKAAKGMNVVYVPSTKIGYFYDATMDPVALDTTEVKPSAPPAAARPPGQPPTSFYGPAVSWQPVLDGLEYFRSQNHYRWHELLYDLEGLLSSGKIPSASAVEMLTAIEKLRSAENALDIAEALNPVMWYFEVAHLVLEFMNPWLHSTTVAPVSGAIYHVFEPRVAKSFNQAVETFRLAMPGKSIDNRFFANWNRPDTDAAPLENLILLTENRSGEIHLIWHQQAVEKIQRLAGEGNLESAFLGVLFHEYLRYQGRSHDEVVSMGFGEEGIGALSRLTPEEVARQFRYVTTYNLPLAVVSNANPEESSRLFLSKIESLEPQLENNQDLIQAYGYRSIENLYWLLRTNYPREFSDLLSTLRTTYGDHLVSYWPALISIARAAGSDNSGPLLKKALPALVRITPDLESLQNVGTQLIRLCIETGDSARRALGSAIPAIADLADSPETLKSFVDDLIEMQSQLGLNAPLFYDDGLTAAKEIFGESFKSHWGDVKRIVAALGSHSSTAFANDLPRMKKRLGPRFESQWPAALDLLETTGLASSLSLEEYVQNFFADNHELRLHQLEYAARQFGRSAGEIWTHILPIARQRWEDKDLDANWDLFYRWILAAGPNIVYLLRNDVLPYDLHTPDELHTLELIEKARRIAKMAPENLQEFAARISFDFLHSGIPIEDLVDFVNFGENPKANLRYVSEFLKGNLDEKRFIEILDRQGHLTVDDLLRATGWADSPVGPVMAVPGIHEMTDEKIWELVSRLNALDIRLEEYLRQQKHPVLLGVEFETSWKHLPFGYAALHRMDGDVKFRVTEIKTQPYANPEILRKLQRGVGLPQQVGVHRSTEKGGVSREDLVLIELLGHLYELAAIERNPAIGSGKQLAGTWGWGNKSVWNYTLRGTDRIVMHTSDWNILGNPWIYKTLIDYATVDPDGWNRDKEMILRRFRGYRNEEVRLSNLLASWTGRASFVAFLKSCQLDIGSDAAFYRYAENPTATQALLYSRVEKAGIKVSISAVNRKPVVEFNDPQLQGRLESYQKVKVAFEYAVDYLRSVDGASKDRLLTQLSRILGGDDRAGEMLQFVENFQIISLAPGDKILISTQKVLKGSLNEIQIPAYQYNALKHLRTIIGDEKGSPVSDLVAIIMERAANKMIADPQLRYYALARGLSAVEESKLGGFSHEGTERVGAIFPGGIPKPKTSTIMDQYSTPLAGVTGAPASVMLLKALADGKSLPEALRLGKKGLWWEMGLGTGLGTLSILSVLGIIPGALILPALVFMAALVFVGYHWHLLKQIKPNSGLSPPSAWEKLGQVITLALYALPGLALAVTHTLNGQIPIESQIFAVAALALAPLIHHLFDQRIFNRLESVSDPRILNLPYVPIGKSREPSISITQDTGSKRNSSARNGFARAWYKWTLDLPEVVPPSGISPIRRFIWVVSRQLLMKLLALFGWDSDRLATFAAHINLRTAGGALQPLYDNIRKLGASPMAQIDAIRRMNDAQQVDLLISALTASNHPRVREEAARKLGELRFSPAIELLRRKAEKDDSESVQEASRIAVQAIEADLTTVAPSSESREARIAAGKILLQLIHQQQMGPGGKRFATASRILENPHIDDILAEIPLGSAYLGIGTQAVALQTPDGRAIRIGAQIERPNVRGVLQADKKMIFGSLQIEWIALGDTANVTPEHYKQIDDLLREQGYVLAEWKAGNIALFSGQPLVIDPGSAVPFSEYEPHRNIFLQTADQSVARAIRSLAQDDPELFPGGLDHFKLVLYRFPETALTAETEIAKYTFPDELAATLKELIAEAKLKAAHFAQPPAAMGNASKTRKIQFLVPDEKYRQELEDYLFSQWVPGAKASIKRGDRTIIGTLARGQGDEEEDWVLVDNSGVRHQIQNFSKHAVSYMGSNLHRLQPMAVTRADGKTYYRFFRNIYIGSRNHLTPKIVGSEIPASDDPYSSPEALIKTTFLNGLESSSMVAAKASNRPLDTLLAAHNFDIGNTAATLKDVWEVSGEGVGVPFLPFSSNPKRAIQSWQNRDNMVIVIEIPEDRVYFATDRPGWEENLNERMKDGPDKAPLMVVEPIGDESEVTYVATHVDPQWIVRIHMPDGDYVAEDSISTTHPPAGTSVSLHNITNPEDKSVVEALTQHYHAVADGKTLLGLPFPGQLEIYKQGFVERYSLNERKWARFKYWYQEVFNEFGRREFQQSVSFEPKPVKETAEALIGILNDLMAQEPARPQAQSGSDKAPASIVYWLVLALTGDVQKAVRAGQRWLGGHPLERLIGLLGGTVAAVMAPTLWWIPFAFWGGHLIFEGLIALGLTRAPPEIGRQALQPSAILKQFFVLVPYGFPAFISQFLSYPLAWSVPVATLSLTTFFWQLWIARRHGIYDDDYLRVVQNRPSILDESLLPRGLTKGITRSARNRRIASHLIAQLDKPERLNLSMDMREREDIADAVKSFGVISSAEVLFSEAGQVFINVLIKMLATGQYKFAFDFVLQYWLKGNGYFLSAHSRIDEIVVSREDRIIPLAGGMAHEMAHGVAFWASLHDYWRRMNSQHRTDRLGLVKTEKRMDVPFPSWFPTGVEFMTLLELAIEQGHESEAEIAKFFLNDGGGPRLRVRWKAAAFLLAALKESSSSAVTDYASAIAILEKGPIDGMSQVGVPYIGTVEVYKEWYDHQFANEDYIPGAIAAGRALGVYWNARKEGWTKNESLISAWETFRNSLNPIEFPSSSAEDATATQPPARSELHERLAKGDVIQLANGSHIFLTRGGQPVLIDAETLDHIRERHQADAIIQGSRIYSHEDVIQLIRETIDRTNGYGLQHWDFGREIGTDSVVPRQTLEKLLGLSLDEAEAKGWIRKIPGQSADRAQPNFNPRAGRYEVVFESLPDGIADHIVAQPTRGINVVLGSVPSSPSAFPGADEVLSAWEIVRKETGIQDISQGIGVITAFPGISAPKFPEDLRIRDDKEKQDASSFWRDHVFVNKSPSPQDNGSTNTSERSFTPSSVVSDVAATALGVFILFDAKSEDLPSFYKELILKMDPATTMFFLMPSVEASRNLADWVQANKPNQRIALFDVGQPHNTWTRDAMLLQETAEGWRIIVSNPRDYDIDVKSIRKFAAMAGIPVVETPLNLQGGDLLFNGKTLLVGSQTALMNRHWGSKDQMTQELQRLYGPEASVHYIEDPFGFHLDTWLTLLPGNRVLIGDPRQGLDRLSDETPETVRAFYQRYKHREHEAVYRRAGHDLLLEKPAISINQSITKGHTSEFEGRLKETERVLTKLGFAVQKLPLVIGYNISDYVNGRNVMMLTGYNNVLILGNRVYLPVVGLSMDNDAKSTYEALGFEVVPVDVRGIIDAQGSLRCASFGVSSEDPEATEKWNRFVQTIVDKTSANNHVVAQSMAPAEPAGTAHISYLFNRWLGKSHEEARQGWIGKLLLEISSIAGFVVAAWQNTSNPDTFTVALAAFWALHLALMIGILRQDKASNQFGAPSSGWGLAGYSVAQAIIFGTYAVIAHSSLGALPFALALTAIAAAHFAYDAVFLRFRRNQARRSNAITKDDGSDIPVSALATAFNNAPKLPHDSGVMDSLMPATEMNRKGSPWYSFGRDLKQTRASLENAPSVLTAA